MRTKNQQLSISEKKTFKNSLSTHLFVRSCCRSRWWCWCRNGRRVSFGGEIRSLFTCEVELWLSSYGMWDHCTWWRWWCGGKCGLTRGYVLWLKQDIQIFIGNYQNPGCKWKSCSQLNSKSPTLKCGIPFAFFGKINVVNKQDFLQVFQGSGIDKRII